MHIQIPEQMQGFIQQQVQEGLYNNAAEVVRDAIRRMMYEREQHLVKKRQDFMSAIQVGIDQIERGQTVPWNDETRAKIREIAQQKIATGAAVDPHVIP